MGSISRHSSFALVVSVLLVACDGDDDEVSRETIATAANAPFPPIAHIVAVSGDVRIRRAGSAGWVAATAGDPLLPGESVQTLGDARAAVRFSQDGATTELDPGTTIRMPERDEHVTRLTHLNGRLTARTGSSEVGSHVEVDLPAGTLLLAATSGAPGELVEAQIEVAEERTSIAMVRGAARLRRTRGGEIEVPANRFVTVAPSGELVEQGWSGRGATAIEPAAGATIRTRSEVSFRWSEVAGASGYTVRIIDPSGTVREVVSSVAVARIPLEAGAHRWDVRATIDAEPTQPTEERALIVELDRSAPTLELQAPVPGESVRGAQLVVRGRTEPGALLDVDGDPVVVSQDGAFHTVRAIARGLTQVVFRVRDDVGNVRVVSRTVTRE